jgi:hypothetical protein
MKYLFLLCRMILLLCVGLLIFLLSIYGTGFLPIELRSYGWPAARADVVAVGGTIVILALAPAIPIQALFPAAAKRAASSIGWLPLAGNIAMHIQTTSTDSRYLFWLIKGSEGLMFWIAVVIGAGRAAKIRRPVHNFETLCHDHV